jgi:protein-L-isoaspartate O-methyltransferase
MTDIFTHAMILNNLSDHWKNNAKILDIGTGHGYLAFVIANILKRR